MTVQSDRDGDSMPAQIAAPFPTDFTDSETVQEGALFQAQGARAADDPPPDPEAVEAALRSVHDPEIPVNIHDLGLIYRHRITAEGDVHIVMTLTAPACPVAGELPHQVAQAVAATPGAGMVSVTLTWDPPWTPDRMTDDARIMLDLL